MTDQYRELRKAALHSRNEEWAKQALQLLDEMEAVGAGGVSGKQITNGGRLGWMKDLAKGGHGMPFVDLIQGEEMMIDDGMSKLHEWVDLINQATDDETKAILRMGLKEEIERMSFDLSERGKPEPTYGDWIKWHGGVNPCPDQDVVVRFADGAEQAGVSCNYFWQHRHCPPSAGDVIAYRMAK